MTRRLDFPCTAAVLALATITTAAAFHHAGFRDAVIADTRTWHQPWRALTGPLVHATWGHLIRDAALVAIAGIGYEARLPRGTFLAGLTLPALAVLASGTVSWYCGLSGLSHALLAAALVHELLRRHGRARLAVAGLTALAAGKPIFELITGRPAFAMALGDHVVQVPLAHAVGALLGALASAHQQPDHHRDHRDDHRDQPAPPARRHGSGPRRRRRIPEPQPHPAQADHRAVA